jgi:threonine dehydrogenase-like Zn-dependent dehydrogenase
MDLATQSSSRTADPGASTMRAAVFRGREQIHLEERPLPTCGPNDAIVRVTLTTICGTDVHIWREEYPVAPGRIVGHEPVGVIEQLGEAVEGYEIGERVLVGAITPCGSCFYCQSHTESQCAGHDEEWEMIGGWRLGNSIDGVQADYFRVPYAQANLAKIPDDLSDEQCILLADIASTGISAAERAEIEIGETVAVFAQGPIGLCATAGARLMGASLIVGVDSIEKRLHLSQTLGADEVIDYTEEDPVAAIKRLTEGRGVDVAIEALGTQQTFQACLDATRPGGRISSLGVYGGKLEIPVESYVYGIGDKQILSTLCPGGKERMRRLMEMVRHGRLDLSALISHRFSLDQIEEAYELFGNQRDGVVKVAITP